MTPSEQLRLATAVAHTVPGAELRLHTRSGEAVIVSWHLPADVDPCLFRNLVIASAEPDRRDLSDQLDAIEIGGTVTDTGGGILASSVDRREQRWVATLVPPHRVVELLDDLGVRAVPDDAMYARVKPDSGLGVTVVAITANDGRYLEFLDEAAAAVAATCFVEEVSHACTDAATSRFADGHIGGAS
jgi:hypothetical protein